MTKTSILIGAIAVAALCTPAHAKPPKRSAPFETPFFVSMMVGDPDVVVSQSGPLELVVRCIPNEALDAVRAARAQFGRRLGAEV